MAADVSTAGDDRIGNYRYARTLQMGQNSVIMEVVQEGTGKRFAMKQMLQSKAEDRSERKAFLLRLSPELYAELRRWASQELRSLNGHIEYLLRDAVRRREGGGR